MGAERVHSVKTAEPRRAGDLMARPRLTAAGVAPDGPGVTLVVAPAGFGKTTLMTEWAAASACPAAWLGLDADDRDPAIFAGNVVAAVRRVVPGFGEGALAAIRSGGAARAVGRALADDLLALEGPLLLLLDDYHEAESVETNALLGEVIRWAPPTLRLAIDSRAMPALRLARARALGQVREIGPEALRFTRAEAAAFLAVRGLDASREAIADRIWEVTEGWPVALRLAVAALQGTHGSQGPLAGIDRLATRPVVREYLIDEVLSAQPPAERICMLRLAVPARIDAEVARDICGIDHEAAAGLLDRLASRDRLLTPLEDGGYRYHALVREAFADRLLATVGPETVASLRAAAAGVAERQGRIAEAIRLLLDAGREGEAEAVAVAERHAPEAEEAIRPAEALRWIRMLPPALVEDSPSLLMVRASSEGYAGQETASEATLDLAEAAMARRMDVSPEERARFAARVAIKRIFNRRSQPFADPEGTIAALDAAIAALGADRSLYHTIALYLQGQLLHGLGRTGEAIERLQSMQAPPGAVPDRLSANIGVPAAEFALWAGQTGLAMEIAERAARDGDALGIANVQAAARTWLGVGCLFRLEFAEARAALAAALANRSAIGMFPEREAMLAGAMLLHLTGQAEEAGAMIDRFLGETKGQRDAVWRAGALTMWARIAVAEGGAEAARPWLAAADALGVDAAMPVIEDSALTRLQVGAQTGGDAARAALAALPAAVAAAEARHDVPNVIRGLLLLALASQDHAGGHAVARNALDRAVALAKPGGVLLPFAELRGPLRRLLRLSGPEALELAAMVDSAMGTVTAGSSFAPRLLTAREEQVLAALREGLTRKEIADRLSLSPATAKRHMEKLYAKLGVAGREEAVASVTSQED